MLKDACRHYTVQSKVKQVECKGNMCTLSVSQGPQSGRTRKTGDTNAQEMVYCETTNQTLKSWNETCP